VQRVQPLKFPGLLDWPDAASGALHQAGPPAAVRVDAAKRAGVKGTSRAVLVQAVCEGCVQRGGGIGGTGWPSSHAGLNDDAKGARRPLARQTIGA
jgi:hypothetical protein